LFVQIFGVAQCSSNQDACQEFSAHIGTGMKDFEKGITLTGTDTQPG